MPNFRSNFVDPAVSVSEFKGRVIESHLRLVPKQSEVVDETLEKLQKFSGYSIIPNVLLDLLPGKLSRNQYDVFMYIVRRTLGFHKTGDAISLSQFQYGLITSEGKRLDFGCGIRRADTVTKTLRELEEMGYISIEHRQAINGAILPNSYTVCLDKLVAVAEEMCEPSVEVQAATAKENLVTEDETVNQPDKPTRKMKEVPPQNEVDKITVLQPRFRTKQNQEPPVNRVAGDFEVNQTASLSERVKIDCQLLSEIGFDFAGALRLALLAEQKGKETDYIAGIIAYSLKHADTSPLGMIKYLIERGETRFLKVVKPPSFTFTKKLLNVGMLNDISLDAINFSSPLILSDTQDYSPPAQFECKDEQALAILEPVKTLSSFNKLPTTQPVFNKPSGCIAEVERDNKRIWKDTVQIVQGKLANPQLAKMLEKANLTELRVEEDTLVAKLDLEQSWQKRLISTTTQRVIEQALRSHVNCPCVIEFSARAENSKGALV